jgi:hypothetical protein
MPQPTAAARRAGLRRLAAVPEAAAPPFDVFESKLRVPELAAGTVSRTGVVNRLRAERSLRLATVVAPAGYGKTTLLAVGRAASARSRGARVASTFNAAFGPDATSTPQRGFGSPSPLNVRTFPTFLVRASSGVTTMRTTERAEAPDVAQELFLLEDPFGILGERDEELHTPSQTAARPRRPE